MTPRVDIDALERSARQLARMLMEDASLDQTRRTEIGQEIVHDLKEQWTQAGMPWPEAIEMGQGFTAFFVHELSRLQQPHRRH